MCAELRRLRMHTDFCGKWEVAQSIISKLILGKIIVAISDKHKRLKVLSFVGFWI
jgi:hypothetical protein